MVNVSATITATRSLGERPPFIVGILHGKPETLFEMEKALNKAFPDTRFHITQRDDKRYLSVINTQMADDSDKEKTE